MRVNWTQKSIHAVVGKRSEKRRRPKMRRERDREWWKVREGWTEEKRGEEMTEPYRALWPRHWLRCTSARDTAKHARSSRERKRERVCPGARTAVATPDIHTHNDARARPCLCTPLVVVVWDMKQIRFVGQLIKAELIRPHSSASLMTRAAHQSRCEQQVKGHGTACP